ncbi:hypothetical protein K1719_017463 [Acacia pycnantha]|nr:hypothetical protein K1719_017463 [Acacia pycnantha]
MGAMGALFPSVGQYYEANEMSTQQNLGVSSVGDDWEGILDDLEAPVVIKSYYDKRIVGCPGGEGEDEHDVVWFWLEKSKPHECPVCSQYFVLLCEGKGNFSSLQQENGPEVKCQGPLLILR